MADDIQQQTGADLSFESEEARATALDELEESPDNLERLEQIRNAPIREASSKDGGEAGGDTPPPEEGAEEQSSEEGGEKPPEEPTKPQPTGQTPPAAAQQWTISADDLPTGPNGEKYATPQEMMKAFKHQADLIGRQTAFIRESLGKQGREGDAAQSVQRVRELEGQLADMRKQLETHGASQQQQQQAQQPRAQQKLDEARTDLNDLLKEIEELDKAEDPLDDDVIRRRNGLMRKVVTASAEVQRLGSQVMGDMHSLRQELATVKQGVEQTQSVLNSSKEQKQQEAAQQALQGELSDMDTFAKENAEFAMSKPAAQVDAEYSDWATNVARIYYGRDPRTLDETRAAVQQLQLRSPDLVNKCQMSGIAVEPSQDVKAYLQLCEMLDYRDGWRKDPVTGRLEQAKRKNPHTGQDEVDRFPGGLEGLKAAYTYRKAVDGTFAQQLAQAHAEGGKAALEAASRRDTGAVELGSEGMGGGAAGAGNREEALRQFAELDEEDVMRRAYAGDTSGLDRYNALATQLGTTLMSVPGYEYRA